MTTTEVPEMTTNRQVLDEIMRDGTHGAYRTTVRYATEPIAVTDMHGVAWLVERVEVTEWLGDDDDDGRSVSVYGRKVLANGKPKAMHAAAIMLPEED